MMVTGRFKKIISFARKLPTPPNLTDAERFVSAPWQTRVLVMVSAAILIGTTWWVASLLGKNMSSGLSLRFNLSCLVYLGLQSYVGADKYTNRRSVEYHRSNWLWRGAIFVLVGTAGAFMASEIWEILVDISQDRRNGPPTFGGIWIGLLIGGCYLLVIEFLLYRNLMIATGWFQKDTVDEQAELARLAQENVQKAQKVEAPMDPERTCTECGLTFRPGRSRCHFCGGAPAPVAGEQ